MWSPFRHVGTLQRALWSVNLSNRTVKSGLVVDCACLDICVDLF